MLIQWLAKQQQTKYIDLQNNNKQNTLTCKTTTNKIHKKQQTNTQKTIENNQHF